MVFIYLLEGHPDYGPKVLASLSQSLARQDKLFTSWLAVAEVLANPKVVHDPNAFLQQTIEGLPFEKIAYDERCIKPFTHLRAQRVAVADSIHLACAATIGADLFLTNDKALHKLHVPGIKFIAGLDSGLL